MDTRQKARSQNRFLLMCSPAVKGFALILAVVGYV